MLKNSIVYGFLSVLFLGLSCTRYSTLHESSHGLEVQDIESYIKEAKEINWRVGKKLSKSVSKGVTVSVKIPSLQKSDLEIINQKHGIDSWVIRVTYLQGSKKIEVGSLFAPFKNPNKHRKSETQQITTIAFSLTYAASALSERFRMFNCPAFGHNKKIKNVYLKGESKKFNLSIQTGDLFNDKPLQAQLTPAMFNIGHELQGTFQIDIGLYRSYDRRLFSRLITLPESIEIDREEIVEIPECSGIYEEKTAPSSKLPFKSWK